MISLAIFGSRLVFAIMAEPCKKPRKESLLELDSFRRKMPHASQSALSTILLEIQRVGIPDVVTRNAMREARELKADTMTPHGPLHVWRDIPPANPSDPPQRIRLAHPLAMLWLAYATCAGFAAFIDAVHDPNPSSVDRPWNLVLYADEVHPGDQIGGKKARKLQAVYFSLLEFGCAALSHEDMWFTMATTRSLKVTLMAGGMAAVFGMILKELFIVGGLAEVGLVLNRAGQPLKRIYIRLGCFIQDGAAHKSTFHCKGESGTKLCVLCRNIFSVKSQICDEDGAAYLQCNVRRKRDLDKATSAELRETVRRLEAHRLVDDDNTFTQREQALGFVYSPYSLLSDSTLDPYLKVADQFLHDWMHMMFVTGVWNLVTNLLCETMRVINNQFYGVVRGYLRSWHWPSRLKATSLHELFADSQRQKNADADHFKCSASEGLSLYSVLRHFVEVVIIPTGECRGQCTAYVCLCAVIDCLVGSARGLVSPRNLEKAVEKFLDAFDAAWGMDFSTPKFHWMLHFGDHLRLLGYLVSCWSLERKHKIPKRYGTDIRNTTTYDSSLIHEVSCDHLSKLDNPDTFKFLKVGLINPRPATKKLLEFVRVALALSVEQWNAIAVRMSSQCRVSKHNVCSVKDVVLVDTNSSGDGSTTIAAGEVWACLEIEGEVVFILTIWTLIAKIHGAATWRVALNPEMFPASSVLESLVWAKHAPGEVKTLLPAHFC